MATYDHNEIRLKQLQEEINELKAQISALQPKPKPKWQPIKRTRNKIGYWVKVAGQVIMADEQTRQQWKEDKEFEKRATAYRKSQK